MVKDELRTVRGAGGAPGPAGKVSLTRRCREAVEASAEEDAGREKGTGFMPSTEPKGRGAGSCGAGGRRHSAASLPPPPAQAGAAIATRRTPAPSEAAGTEPGHGERRDGRAGGGAGSAGPG